MEYPCGNAVKFSGKLFGKLKLDRFRVRRAICVNSQLAFLFSMPFA